MTDTEKRKLSAKKLLSDIRSGMDDSGLKLKYDLSDKGLESVCMRLTAAGLLTEDEIRLLKPRQSSRETFREIPKGAQWRCPACNAPQAAELPECPVCGVVAAKFVARQGSGAAYRASRDVGPSDRTGWMPVITSIVVFALVGGALLVWSSHRAKETSKISALDTGTQSFQPVESEVDQPQENSGDSESTSKDYTEVLIDDSQESMVPPAPVDVIPQEAPQRTVAVPREQAPPPLERSEYVTGVLRQFSSRDFKKEVVEASKTYPVLFQFYSET